MTVNEDDKNITHFHSAFESYPDVDWYLTRGGRYKMDFQSTFSKLCSCMKIVVQLATLITEANAINITGAYTPSIS